MSADTPAAVHDTRVRDDHAQPAKPDRARPAAQASSRLPDAGRPQQSAQAFNRADYNRARHEQPPIQRSGDGGSRRQADTTGRAVGGTGDRRADRAASWRPAGAVGGNSRPDSLNRADCNRARHEAPPIQRSGETGHHEPPGAKVRPGDGTGRAEHPTDRRPAETATGEQPREEALNRADYNQARHAAPPIQRQAEHAEHGREAANDRLLSSGDSAHRDHGGAQSAAQHQEGQRPRQEAPSVGPAEAERTAATGGRQDAPGADGNAGRQAEPEAPTKVYVDGHEIEVTGDLADGVWVQGLPGEVPGKAGDVFATPEKDAAEKPRGDRLFNKVAEISDDLLDSAEKNVNTASQIIERPPAHAEVPVHVHRHTPEAQQHAPEAGGLATGVLALGIMLWAGSRWISGRLKGAHDARDG